MIPSLRWSCACAFATEVVGGECPENMEAGEGKM